VTLSTHAISFFIISIQLYLFLNFGVSNLVCLFVVSKTNPMVDLLSSRSLAQSTSQYLIISWGGSLSNHNLNCKVHYKFQKMCFTIIQCSKLGLAMCWLTLLIRYVKSDQVHHGIHQGSNSLLIRNPNHLNIFVHIFFQLCFGIKWYLMALQSSMWKC